MCYFDWFRKRTANEAIFSDSAVIWKSMLSPVAKVEKLRTLKSPALKTLGMLPPGLTVSLEANVFGSSLQIFPWWALTSFHIMSWVFLKLLPLWDASKPHEGPGEAGLVQEDLSEPGAACRDGGNICATSGKLGRHRALPRDVKHFLEILSAWRKEMSCCPPLLELVEEFGQLQVGLGKMHLFCLFLFFF